MTRRRGVAVGTVALAAVAGLAFAAPRVVLPQAAGAAESPTPSNGGAEQQTASVERRTLTVGEELDGTLGYEGERNVVNQRNGTLTWTPAAGTVVGSGERLYELDGADRPVLLFGNRPAWRALDEDAANGADIKQLEENLAALGFLDEDEVDRNWDADTTEAVEDWQADRGVEDDGEIGLGEVVFLPGELRVTEASTALGTHVGPGQPVLEGTTTRRVVTIDLEADRTDLIAQGDAVEIELPDGSTTTGTVAEVGRVAQAQTDPSGEAGTPTVTVTVELDDPAASAAWDAAPVEVRVVRESREDVLTVPVSALLALLEGGYAVELVAADGRTRLVGVELGLFQDGFVEVRSDELAEGDRVVVPS